MKQQFEYGAQLDLLTRGELRDELAVTTQRIEQQLTRSLKYIRLGPIAVPITNGTAQLTGGSQAGTGPRAGFVWAIRRLSFMGLTSGATPDVVNIYRGNTNIPALWQFNGNNFAYTFSNVQMLLLDGEHIDVMGTGLAATGDVWFAGDVVEVAAPEIGKLL